MNLQASMEKESDCLESIFQSCVISKDKKEVFLFFEGKDDYKYYVSRLSQYINNKEHAIYICECKNNVLKICDMINKQSSLVNNNKLLYFIDSDYNKNINISSDIYITSSYSIENYYFTDTAIKRMLIAICGISEEKEDDKKDLENVLNFFKSKLNVIVDEIIFANAWYSLQVKNTEHLLNYPNLSKINEYNIIKNINKTEVLSELVENSIELKESEIVKEINRLKEKPIERIRGKYFLQALTPILKGILQDAGKKDSKREIFLKKRKIHLNLSDILCELSAYADTPEALYNYIEKRLSLCE